MNKSILNASLDFEGVLINLHLYMDNDLLIFELKQKLKGIGSTVVEALLLNAKDINQSSSLIVELLKEKDINNFSVDWQGVLGDYVMEGIAG